MDLCKSPPCHICHLLLEKELQVPRSLGCLSTVPGWFYHIQWKWFIYIVYGIQCQGNLHMLDKMLVHSVWRLHVYPWWAAEDKLTLHQLTSGAWVGRESPDVEGSKALSPLVLWGLRVELMSVSPHPCSHHCQALGKQHYLQFCNLILAFPIKGSKSWNGFLLNSFCLLKLRI